MIRRPLRNASVVAIAATVALASGACGSGFNDRGWVLSPGARHRHRPGSGVHRRPRCGKAGQGLTYVEAMLERERSISTYVGEGFAIPHGTLEGDNEREGVVT